MFSKLLRRQRAVAFFTVVGALGTAGRLSAQIHTTGGLMVSATDGGTRPAQTTTRLVSPP